VRLLLDSDRAIRLIDCCCCCRCCCLLLPAVLSQERVSRQDTGRDRFPYTTRAHHAIARRGCREHSKNLLDELTSGRSRNHHRRCLMDSLFLAIAVSALGLVDLSLLLRIIPPFHLPDLTINFRRYGELHQLPFHPNQACQTRFCS
jgi:hypothetical protein